MKSALAIVGLTAALLSAPAVGAAPGWKVFRESAGAYVLNYPAAFHISPARGQACSNGDCRPLEEAILSGPEGSMTLVVQRGINPKQLAVRDWYQALVHRPLDPSMERIATVAGRDAVRRGPFAPGAVVRSVNGKVVSRTSGMLPDDTIFLPLGASDILTVVVHARTPAANAAFDRILASLRVGG